MKQILLLHGVNLNYLGKRDPKHYGTLTLADMIGVTCEAATQYGLCVLPYQSNHEGDLVDQIQAEAHKSIGIIINPGAWTHYSYAIHDALVDSKLPVVEVHLSDIAGREAWRKRSVIAPACIAQIKGQKAEGYRQAVTALVKYLTIKAGNHDNCTQITSKCEYRSNFNTRRGAREAEERSVYNRYMSTEASVQQSRGLKGKWYNSKTVLNAVIGNPIIHSLSPDLHNDLYAHLQINASMLAFSLDAVGPLVAAMRTLKMHLMAVTAPFKQSIMKHLDVCSPDSKAVGAVNTVIQKSGKLHGYNTDIAGIDHALRNIAYAGKPVLILGAGGAARAAGYCMQQAGAHIFWYNRTYKHAVDLAQSFSGTVLKSRDDLMQEKVSLIINTTPLGTFPNVSHSPLPAHYAFSADQAVFDMVYHPVETALLQAAKKQGAQGISGIDMFIGQGLAQITLAYGKSAAKDDQAYLSVLKTQLIAAQKNG